MPDLYAQAVNTSLKLKSGTSALPIQKKKKKKAKPQTESDSRSTDVDVPSSDAVRDAQMAKKSTSHSRSTRTKAERNIMEMQDKRQTERIMKKAEKTHKQQVEEFNKHLDSLSEHYDIPKVSWTK